LVTVTAAALASAALLVSFGSVPSAAAPGGATYVVKLETDIENGRPQGRSRREIAAVVGLDERTVDWHLTQADRKLAKASALLERVRGREQ
jgi:hypothetical protein